MDGHFFHKASLYTIIAVLSIFVLLCIHGDLVKIGISCPNKYEFISPDLNCAEDIQDQTESLRQSVKSITEKEKLAGRANKISVFYRDLNNKQWFGIDENESFAPGSLLKLPLTIAYYKLSEIDPSALSQKLKFTFDKNFGDLNVNQTVQPEDPLVSGTEYSVSDLINNMLVYSDNNPVPLLTGAINQKFLKKVYIDLGVFIPTSGGIEQDFLSVKTYGGILRALYTASYLNQSSSNEVLGTLTKVSFTNGLVKGVPSDVAVAHKYGERFMTDDTTNAKMFELHDCGIIYKPGRPYILCVMTKGDSYDNLAKVIADVSKTVYDNQ